MLATGASNSPANNPDVAAAVAHTHITIVDASKALLAWAVNCSQPVISVLLRARLMLEFPQRILPVSVAKWGAFSTERIWLASLLWRNWLTVFSP